uniref:IL-12B n=1 Tax=Catharus ustulatus TaxID=91951 RepID=A0A8C3U6H4_CATUS
MWSAGAGWGLWDRVLLRPRGTQPLGLSLWGTICSHHSPSLTTGSPSAVQVGNLNEDVVVRCNTSEQHIYWTLNGEEDPMAELVPKGQNLTILGLDLPATGNYSCWAGPLLHSLAPSGEEEINVSCQAESYNGSFHCSWPGPSSAIFRARLTRRWVDGSMGPWVPVANPSFCPFGEELHPLKLHLEGLSDTSYLNLSRHFFIRDIVRPDPPQELILQQRGEQLHLVWAPPASWPLPKSYFALLYHLQYELHNGTQVTGRFLEGVEETPVQAGARRVRISCRDPYNPPAWSPWSAWMSLEAP